MNRHPIPRATNVSKPRLDDSDRRILGVLTRDGRASHRQIAKQTNLSLATVNRRIRRLEDADIIRNYTTIIDPEALGWGLTTIVGLRIEKGHLRTVQEKIAQDHRVFAVYDVTGEWDGIVLARLQDRADLDDLAKTTLSLEHVQRTTTLVVLKTVQENAVTQVST